MLAATQGIIWLEICSPAGVERVALELTPDSTPASQTQGDAHCGYCLLQQHINNFLQYLTIAELLKNHISHEGPPPSSARAPQAAELSSAFLIAEKRS